MKTTTITAFIIFSFLNFNCKAETDKVLLEELRGLSNLTTLEFKLSKVVGYEDKKFYGNRNIYFETIAIAKFGIDLNKTKILSSDMILGEIHLQVPHAEILLFSMPTDKIQEVYSEADLLRKKFSLKEKEKILRQGEKEIRLSLNSNIYRIRAEKNAETILSSWLNIVGFQKIKYTYMDKKK